MSIEKKNKALSRLPQYTPREETWTSIEQGLYVQESLQGLPDYTPSDTIWQAISKDLESKNQLNWKRHLAVAATILFVVSSHAILNRVSQKEDTFQYSKEEVDLKLLETDWSTTEATTTLINSFCEVRKIACASPVFKELEEELTTLNNAKTELETAMQLVGKNTDLIAQMTSIELERSILLKEMMNEVL